MIPESRVTSHVIGRVAAILAIAGMLASTPVHAAVTFKRGFLTITQGQARAFLNVEVAETPESRALGLGNRASLASHSGRRLVHGPRGAGAYGEAACRSAGGVAVRT